MTDPFAPYFKAIQEMDVSTATEHTLRGPLDNLLKALAGDRNRSLKVIHEPKKDRSGLGAPDFKCKLNEAIVGYLESKRIGENLDAVLKSEQIAKYKQLSGNIVLTDYLEWIWLRDDRVIERETLCHASDAGSRRARLDPDKTRKVAALITGFLSVAPQGLATARQLSDALAARCQSLRDFLFEELHRQDEKHRGGPLYGLYLSFRENVFHELALVEFADAFAQTLGYGLFLAKLNAGQETRITLQNAKNHVSANFELIRELVGFLDELEKDEYRNIKWLVEEILSIMNMLDVAAFREDLAFTARQAKLFPPTEEERLLFAKDPYVYFYEGFLKVYDKEIRKARGVYYTPRPVVDFIVRAVNDVLKDTFGIRDGLADRKRVTVLDFATGTGTFLLEVLHRIFETTRKGVRAKIVREHVLKNLYGFEYLIAPYTVAHLKLSQFLRDQGYVMKSDERLKIYLTNTLEPITPQANWLLPALSREVEQAQEIKDKPILVITGNPPYSGHSMNIGEWITEQIEDYKWVDGRELGERNPKWLQDDYVKFIRFAQWKMEQVEEGVVGIITNHSFLDNPTFRGMRQSLMRTFDRMYFLDLHGNTKKKERTPEGGKDENVFDIVQGVAISLLVKKKGLPKGVYHADLWGDRKGKYRALLEAEKDTVEWTELRPVTPWYLFIPQNWELREEYEQGWKLKDIFQINSVGIVTARDKLTIHYTKDELWQTVRDFANLSNEKAREKYALGKDAKDWKVEFAQQDLGRSGLLKTNVVPVVYRPFDVRYTYYTGRSSGFHCRPRERVMRHMLTGDNLGLCVSKGKEISGIWEHVFCTDQMIQHHTVSLKEVNYLFPLYLYPSSDSKERIENFNPKFRTFIDEKYKRSCNPQEILGYIYAVLHGPTYRDKYRDFLKLDFPRIPFVNERKVFETLSTLGWELMQAHLLNFVPRAADVELSDAGDISEDFQVEKPVYDAQRERLYVNEKKYFYPVPQDTWDFHIGGYQVLDKYLKSRKGRVLSLDEIENVQNVVKVLRFTIDQMQRIDACWKP